MKKNHSLLYALIISLTALFFFSPSSRANSYTGTISTSQGNFTIRGSNWRRVKEVLERISKMVNNKTFIPILDGGEYSKICTAKGYERHHLVSTAFCKKHQIPYRHAPAVLISKELHKQTGSFGCLKGSQIYRDRENQIFNTAIEQNDHNGAIYQVYSFGLDNLIDILQPEYSKLTEEKVKLMTPVKQARSSTWLKNVPSAQKIYTPTQNSQDTNPSKQFFYSRLACISNPPGSSIDAPTSNLPIPCTPLKSSHRKR